MPQPRRLIFFALLLGLSVSAMAAEPEKMAFGPGEQSTYRVSFLGIGAGSAQITVGAPTQQYGRSVWPIVSLAKSDALFSIYPIRDKYVSYWEPSSQKTLGSDLFAEENRKRRRQTVRIDHAERKAYVNKTADGAQPQELTVDIEANTSDMATATFMLRNYDLQVGKSYQTPVFTGARVFPLRGTVEGITRLNVNGTDREVFKVRVQTAFTGSLESKRDLVAYFTTDARRVPVRIEADFLIGKLAADLTDYKPGAEIAVSDVRPASTADAKN
ncbi:MAG: DUF3108 domain-containing protein [Myxococcaceae bacterium]